MKGCTSGFGEGEGRKEGEGGWFLFYSPLAVEGGVILGEGR